jgi:hypothetical protein
MVQTALTLLYLALLAQMVQMALTLLCLVLLVQMVQMVQTARARTRLLLQTVSLALKQSGWLLLSAHREMLAQTETNTTRTAQTRLLWQTTLR